MNNIKDIFSGFTSLPFLFVGSGLSRRYLGLPDWEGLLRHFIGLYSDQELAYEYYVNNAKLELSTQGIHDLGLLLPKVASLVEIDFNEAWFKDIKFSENRKLFASEVAKRISPFKIEVANFIKSNSQENSCTNEYKMEIDLLKKIADKSINGIITTNYDLLIQNLFKDKDYDCFVGQDDLLFSPPNGIRDIYKIHGCCTEPDSIIVTYEDYVKFREKSAYIAAKLLTIFIEHPVIFFGYSMDDPNIINILESIVYCLNDEKIEQLTSRFFFIQRNNFSDEIEITNITRQFNNASIPMKGIKTNNFSIIYEALLNVRAKYNPRVLKMLKKDIYNLVVTNENTGSAIATTHIDDDNVDEIEVIIGVGLKSLALNGIVGISTIDIFKDLVFDNFDFLAYEEFETEFLNEVLPQQLSRSSYSLPVFKYIRGENILQSNLQNYVSSKNCLDDFLSEHLKQNKRRPNRLQSIDEILEKIRDLDQQLLSMAILDEEQINLVQLETYLKNILNEKQDILDKKHSTNVRRLIKIYDFLKYKNSLPQRGQDS